MNGIGRASLRLQTLRLMKTVIILCCFHILDDNTPRIFFISFFSLFFSAFSVSSAISDDEDPYFLSLYFVLYFSTTDEHTIVSNWISDHIEKSFKMIYFAALFVSGIRVVVINHTHKEAVRVDFFFVYSHSHATYRSWRGGSLQAPLCPPPRLAVRVDDSL